MSPAGGSSGSHLTTRILEITVTRCLSRGPLRKWVVNVDEPGQALRSIELEDPDDSRSYTEHDTFLSSPDARIRSKRVDDDIRQTRIQTYCRSIGRQLGLDEMTDPRNKKGNLKIYVCESVHETERCSIHGLRWELLEHNAFTEACGYRIQVTRICNGFRPNDLYLRRFHHQTPTRVLLVVARSWQLAPPTPHPNDHYADLSPDLVQYTLCRLARFCRQQGRTFILHIVRPGGIDALTKHLQTAKLSNLSYDMIHFDLHGRISPDDDQPELLFALPYNSTFPSSISDDKLDFSPSFFEPVKAETVAKLLQEYQVKLVALSSCQSAYAQNGPISNLCHTFLKHGVNAVTAMAFTVRGSTARLYFEGFYSSLILSGASFSAASASGRAYVRDNDDEPLGLSESEPSALPGFYRCGRTDSAERRNSQSWTSNQQHIKSKWVAIAWLLGFMLARFVEWRRMIRVRLRVSFALLIFCIILHRKFGRSVDLRALWKGFQRQQYNPSESRGEFLRRLRSEPSESSEMAFGRTVLEDQLAEHNSVFIQLESSPMSPKQKKDLEYAVEIWKMTEFVDDVTFVKSEQLTSPTWHYKEYLKRNIFSLTSCRPWVTSCNLDTERTGKWDGKGAEIQASMIILTDFDYLFEDHQRGKRETALSRVSSLRNWLSKDQVVYLVFIGNADVPWESGDINPNDHPWVQGPKLFANRDLGMIRGGWGV
ncbi:hypothetical protein CDV36_006869 [Fusarium kuroshium]|uniref:CHAT domain-containing protein n=1 Tax=Fusarium kuroshium TaxID=2010991 RepID=A0A3M2S7D8_9HYPO|nr:hypothetical protein CDV36_006869 [Fusarium kuroshium]